MPTDEPSQPDSFDLIQEQSSVEATSEFNNQEEKHLFNEKERKETIRQHMHSVFICLIWIAFIFAVATFMVRILHLVLPNGLHWLSAEQVQHIDKFLFSGAIGGFLGKYVNKII